MILRYIIIPDRRKYDIIQTVFSNKQTKILLDIAVEANKKGKDTH